MEAAMNSEVTVAVLLDFPLPTMTPFFSFFPAKGFICLSDSATLRVNEETLLASVLWSHLFLATFSPLGPLFRCEFVR